MSISELQYHYQLDFTVRDYELDMEGVVNNAQYLNYLEHTRHEFLKTIDIDFAALVESGLNLVVVRSEVDYKAPLKSGMEFTVKTRFEKISKIKIAFYQDIFLKTDQKLIAKAKIIGACINQKGRPVFLKEWNDIFDHLNFIPNQV
jgi:acyl-CoA thioester hydrolase